MKMSKVLMLLLLACFNSACAHPVTDLIVIVGVRDYEMSTIAKEVQNICALNPKVIAIDVQFPDFYGDDEDSLFIAALNSCANVVLPSQIRQYTYDDRDYLDTLGCHPAFRTKAKTGFVNTILEYDDYYTLKRFSIREKVNGKTEYHFAVRTAMSYDSIKAMKFVNSHAKIVDVDYQKDQTKFKRIRASYALSNELKREDIEGKIVLIGSFWPMEGYPPDIYVSPLNQTPEQGADMWGVIYLANVVAQVLK